MPKKRYTNQSAFDASVAHMRGMKERCVSVSTGKCSYLNDKGEKCAIGGILPEGELNKVVEGMPVATVLNLMDRGFVPSLSKCSRGLLLDLQATHDCQENWKISRKGLTARAEATLAEIASDYGVVYTERTS